MRPFLFIALLIFLPLSSVAQQALAPGDIAIIGVNSDNPDAFAFVALVDIVAGTEIGFVNHGWQASGSFRAIEDELFYTAPNTLPAGTVVTLTDVAGSPRFSTDGDQLIAFQGTVDSPTMIYAIHFDGNGWQSDATSSNTSALPTGLRKDVTAIAVDECDNLTYAGSTSGTKRFLLKIISDKSNWTCDNSKRLTFPSSFDVDSSGDGSNQIPTWYSRPPALSTTFVGQTISMVFDAVGAYGSSVIYSGIDLPSGSAFGIDSGYFEWTPASSQEGSHTFTVVASDGVGQISHSVTIVVDSFESGQVPSLNRYLDYGRLVARSEMAQVEFWVTDVQGQDLSYSIKPNDLGASIEEFVSPAGFCCSDAQRFLWQADADPGIYKFEVTATDTDGYSVNVPVYIGVSGTLFDWATSAELADNLLAWHGPNGTLGYDVARDTMYAVIDRQNNGLVEGIYTGYTTSLGAGDPSTTMFEGGINAEHSWPQSMGAGEEPQRSDMHALFPAKATVTSTRSNHPFVEIPDNETTSWFREGISLTQIPSSEIDEWSEYAPGRFEPRESVKGDIARALLYFKTMYPNDAGEDFFGEVEPVLAAWNELDPPSGWEIFRSGRISEYQGNVNPFIIDPTLPERLYGLSTARENEHLPSDLKLVSFYPNPASESVVIEIRGARGGTVTFTLYDSLGRVSKRSEAVEGFNKLSVQGLSNGVYYLVVEANGKVLRRPVTVLR